MLFVFSNVSGGGCFLMFLFHIAPTILPRSFLKTVFLKASLEQDWEKTGRKPYFFGSKGSNGVKRGQMVSKRVNWYHEFGETKNIFY